MRERVRLVPSEEIAALLMRSLGSSHPSPHPPNVAIIRRSKFAAHLSLFIRDVDPVCGDEDGDGRDERWPGADPYRDAEGDYNQSEVHRVACKTVWTVGDELAIGG
jgi:hypothetical protein